MYKIAVIGLGYVGLPLAIELSKKFETIGFDIDQSRIADLRIGFDKTGEVVSSTALDQVFYTNEIDDIRTCNFYIITVPTPVYEDRSPNFSPLVSASRMIGGILKKGDVVVYESTVYPGCTEEVCIPELETHSNLRYNIDFGVGYSPERINPGDKENTLTNIQKVVSGSSESSLKSIYHVYDTIIDAGLHVAQNIKVAEASKVIENCQRDVNIGFVNSLVPMCDVLGISIHDVLDAAGTKWNFLKFTPGLVGGHCISVDPYYLLHAANKHNVPLAMIEAARDANENLASVLSMKIVKHILKSGVNPLDSTIVLYGATFKEDCPDIRNSKTFQLYRELTDKWNLQVDIVDPVADPVEVRAEHDLVIHKTVPSRATTVVVIVPHKEVEQHLKELVETKSGKVGLLDIKGTLPAGIKDHFEVISI